MLLVHTTYEVCATADIPGTYVFVKTCCDSEHLALQRSRQEFQDKSVIPQEGRNAIRNCIFSEK